MEILLWINVGILYVIMGVGYTNISDTAFKILAYDKPPKIMTILVWPFMLIIDAFIDFEKWIKL
jgi:hypothetical protein